MISTRCSIDFHSRESSSAIARRQFAPLAAFSILTDLGLTSGEVIWTGGYAYSFPASPRDWKALPPPALYCLSERAYWQVKSRLDLAVSDLGSITVKNIAEPVHVYSLEVGKTASAKATKPAAPSNVRYLCR